MFWKELWIHGSFQLFPTIQVQEESDERLNIFQLVQEFYAMEALSAMLLMNQGSRFHPLRHSHERWRRDFGNFQNEYITKFAAAIYDYTALVVAAELRHCRKRASRHIKGYYNSDLDRDMVYKDCSAYAPKDILTAGIRMFDTNSVKWEGGFGGEKWYQIAKAGLMKDTVCDCVFIDHCVDLAHNNSIYFDKGAGIFFLPCVVQYQEFLNFKRSCFPQDLMEVGHGDIFRKLLSRAVTLNLAEHLPPYVSTRACKTSESALLDYRPVVWNGKPLNHSESHIVQSCHCSVPKRDEERSKYALCA